MSLISQVQWECITRIMSWRHGLHHEQQRDRSCSLPKIQMACQHIQQAKKAWARTFPTNGDAAEALCAICTKHGPQKNPQPQLQRWLQLEIPRCDRNTFRVDGRARAISPVVLLQLNCLASARSQHHIKRTAVWCSLADSASSESTNQQQPETLRIDMSSANSRHV